MLRILLVEDEYVVREGIKKIDWSSHGYEFVGEASDGEVALPMIRKTLPDIVITDIKMPFMDGLELTRQIKKEYPDIEIIILSGYEEFDYARQAVELGVSKYLSKPISSAELVKEIDTLRDGIEAKKKEKEISLRYERDMAEDAEKARKDFFMELVYGQKSVSQLLEDADALNIDLSASAYAIVMCCINEKGPDGSENISPRQEVCDRLAVWSESHRDVFICFDRDLEGLAILYKGQDVDDVTENVRKYSTEFEEIISEYDYIRYYGGAGRAVERLSELHISYESAARAYAHRYFDQSNRVVYDGENPHDISPSGDGTGVNEGSDVAFDAIDVRNTHRQRLTEYLKTGEGSMAVYFVDELMDSTGMEALKSLVFRQYITMDIYFTVIDFVTGIGVSRDRIEPPDPAVGVASDIDSMREYLVRIISGAISERDGVSHSRYKDITDKAIAYIEEHYMDEDLSLNTLAEYVRFSPNHLSMIFSQETGVTFSRYLIEFRLNKAKEALKCTSKKSSEIALEVGYRDPHYFSYMFKKLTGMTPTQYREGE